MNVSEERVEKALDYLINSSDDLARAASRAKYLEHKRSVVKAAAFSEAEGSQGERAEKAHMSKEYRECLEEMREAVYEHERIKANRMAAQLLIDMWRTQKASERSGL